MVRCRPNVKLRLQILNVSTPNIDAFCFEKILKIEGESRVRAPNRVKVGTTFHNGLEFRIGIEAVDYGEEHQARLGDAKMVEKLDARRCSKWNQYIHHQDHGITACKSWR